MRAEFYRPDAPEEIVGSARWQPGSLPAIHADGDDGQQRLGRIFRPTPVVIDDRSLRSFGTGGPAVLQPGPLQWFQAAARTRGLIEGLSVRFVDEGAGDAMGWDPAGAYRPFADAIERKLTMGDMRRRSEAPPGR